MPFDLFFDPPTFEVQRVQPVAAFKWQRLNSQDVQYTIAAEEQYLQFHRLMLERLRHTQAGRAANPTYRYQLDLSLRAGMVKAAVMVAASILEAALRALAEARNYPLPNNPRYRTFGRVIGAWEQNGVPRADVAAIWPSVLALHEVRNFVHLHEAAQAAEAEWAHVLGREQQLLDGALAAIEHVSQIVA